MRTPAHVPLLHMFKIRAFECPLASLANSGALVAMGAMAIENGFCGFFRAKPVHMAKPHAECEGCWQEYLLLQQQACKIFPRRYLQDVNWMHWGEADASQAPCS